MLFKGICLNVFVINLKTVFKLIFKKQQITINMYSQLIFDSILDNSKQALVDVLKQYDIQIPDKQKQIIVEQFTNMMSLKQRTVEEPVKEKTPVEKPKKTMDKPETLEPVCKPVTTSNTTVNSQKCICRVWNTGLGTQCTRDKKQGDFCKVHSKKYEQDKLDFGVVTGPRPTHYSKTTDLKGKKPGSLIKWKQETVKQPEQTEEEDESVKQLTQILKKDEHSSDEEIQEIEGHQEPDFGKQDDSQDTLLKSESKSDIHNILDEDVSTIEPDDQIELDGIVYEQCVLDDNVVYICDDMGKKIAQWNGHDQSTIEWNSKMDEDNHKQLINQKK